VWARRSRSATVRPGSPGPPWSRAWPAVRDAEPRRLTPARAGSAGASRPATR
jgi:hypothetical protein